MTDTKPDPLPSDALGQTAPLHSAWPTQLVEPYRQHLVDRADEAQRRLAEAAEHYEALGERTDRELDQLLAKIPDVGDNPTVVEWLTRRAAQAEHDLARSRLELTMQETLVKQQQIAYEGRIAGSRVAHIDDLTEAGPYTAGNDTQLAIIELDLQESAIQLAHEKAVLDIDRERLDLSKRMHREINTALRKARLSAESARKR